MCIAAPMSQHFQIAAVIAIKDLLAGLAGDTEPTSSRHRLSVQQAGNELQPFQLARGAMVRNSNTDAGFKTDGPAWFRHRDLPNRSIFSDACPSGLDLYSLYVLIRDDRSTRELARADPEAAGRTGRSSRPKTGFLLRGSRCAAPGKT
jgi:hypothetical protein